MTMDSWGPLAGFSVGFFLLMGTLWLFLVFLWITVPFSIFAIRNQLKQQLAVLQRIEQRLADLALPPPPPVPPAASEPLPRMPPGLPTGSL
jgi:hypothetical protein